MPAPTRPEELLQLVEKSAVVDEKRLQPYVENLRISGSIPAETNKLAGMMVRDGILTDFQAQQLLMGKWRRFTIGKYKVLERLGKGGMGSVYLCEHKLMRRRVAVKVLPTAKAAEPSSLERFYREAKVAASLDHPNIVHAYDIDQDDTLHFLVMEYVDGANVQDIVKKSGPLSPERAAHYVYQATQGLEHAHASGIVHRDIKPGNLLVDRTGTLKILDMGLARFFNDTDDILTRKYDENVLGTADYLAPEQAVDSHEADTRADIYSLGATFYFMLTGRTPFEEGTVAQKLIWHQTRQPKSVRSYRSDVSAEMEAIITKMMAKKPEDRYQFPSEVARALHPWVQQPIAPPTADELPRLCPAAAGPGAAEGTQTGFSTHSGPGSSKKNWQVSSASPSTPIPQPKAANRQTAPLPKTDIPQAVAKVPSQNQPSIPSREPGRAVKQAQSASAKTTGPSYLPTLPGQSGTTPAVNSSAEQTWAGLTDDTDPPSAESGTSAKAASSFRSQSSGGVPAYRVWMIITIVVTIGVVIALVLGFSLLIHILNQTPPQREPLIVSKVKTGDGVFPTISRALRKAQSGDVIELWDDRYSENVIVDSKRGKTAITLRAAQGKKVVWTHRFDDGRPLLQLSNAAMFHLDAQGIVFDGQSKLDTLLLITLQGPGLKISDPTLTGYRKHGIRIMNSQGSNRKWIELNNIRKKSAKDESKLIYFDANPDISPPVNDFIDLRHCFPVGIGPQNELGRKNAKVTGEHIKLPNGFSWK